MLQPTLVGKVLQVRRKACVHWSVLVCVLVCVLVSVLAGHDRAVHDLTRNMMPSGRFSPASRKKPKEGLDRPRETCIPSLESTILASS